MLRFLLRIFFRRTRRSRSILVATKRAWQSSGTRPSPHVEAGPQLGEIISGRCWVIDGDTIVISGIRIRLFGIDAPELNHPYGNNSKFALVNLCKGRTVTAIVQDHSSYERIVAKCYLSDGTDLSAELVKLGLAIDWEKFSGGVYRQFEPMDARKKLWRADAKQRGRLIE